MTQEEREQSLDDPTLIKQRIDDYEMPSLLIKILKSIQKNQVVQLTTTQVDKLRTNFPSDFLDQYAVFPEAANVPIKLTVALFGIQNTRYFYKFSVAQKLANVERIKATAGRFFKSGNLKKAARIYQRINGWYNFGDAANNYLKEDESCE